MNEPLARALTQLCSRRWRSRYGAEYQALLSELPGTPSAVGDALAFGILSRAGELAAYALLAACLVLVVWASVLSTRDRHIAARAGREAPAVVAVCRAYSSATQSGTIGERRCLT